MPKNQSLPFFVDNISGSRALASFLVEDGASMILRRLTRTVYGWLPRDEGLVIFGDWSGAAMYSASQLRFSRAP